MKKNTIMTVKELKVEVAKLGEINFTNALAGNKKPILIEQLAVVLGTEVGPIKAAIEENKHQKADIVRFIYNAVTGENSLQVQPKECTTATDVEKEAPVNNTEVTDAPVISEKKLLTVLKSIYKVTKENIVAGREAVRGTTTEEVNNILINFKLNDENISTLLSILYKNGYLFNDTADNGNCYVGFNSDAANALAKRISNVTTRKVQTAPVQPEEQQLPVQEQEKKDFLDDNDVKEYYTFLKNRDMLYVPTRLHGSLAKYNGKYFTMKLIKARAAMAFILARKFNCEESVVGIKNIDAGMDELAKRGFLFAVKVVDSKGNSVIQYFVTNAANKFMKEKGFCKENFFVIKK